MVSKKAGKQRQAQTDAPIHVRRKRTRARLVSDDPDLALIRTVTVRVGDEVEVFVERFGFPNSAKTDSRGKRLGQSAVERSSRVSLVSIPGGYVQSKE